MKVSEALEQLRITLDDQWVYRADEDAIRALIASHEALRNAAGPVVDLWRAGTGRLNVLAAHGLCEAFDEACK